MTRQSIEAALANALRQAVTRLPTDVLSALERARAEETSPLAVGQLDILLENVDIARRAGVPLCQDTGLLLFYVDAGARSPWLGALRSCIESAVAQATTDVPLRPNTVDPLTGVSAVDNLGRGMPWIRWNLVDGDDVVVSILPKGGGSDAASRLVMLPCDTGPVEIVRAVIDHVAACEGKACPPMVIGLGIGGPAEGALFLATRALLRGLGSRHADPDVAELEDEILDLANRTGVGPAGLGGATTCLDVHAEVACRHPACFPLGIVISCWAERRAKVVVHADGSAEVVAP
ncbi:MAG: fumarate hydratase [Candidatus Bipolaricaulis sp.]|nr:fumarate hydratase [Candidatus Bipolaricaulis sp.]